MKIKRHFVYTKDESHGEMGLMPLWIPEAAEFNVCVTTSGLVHDCLEHSLSDTGLFHQEVTAFGRLMVMRSAVPMYSHKEWLDDMGRELGGILLDMVEGSKTYDKNVDVLCENRISGQEVSTPRYAKKISILVDSFVDYCRREHEVQALIDTSPDYLNRFIRGWLNYGYFDVHRRYGDTLKVETLGHSLYEQRFKDTIQKELDKMHKTLHDGYGVTAVFDLEEEYNPKLRFVTHGHECGWLKHRLSIRKYGP